MRVGGWRVCGRWPVLGGFLCCFDVGEGVLGVVLGAGVAGVADGEGAAVDVLGVLAAGVSGGEGVVALGLGGFGLGVDGGAGVGVAVTGPGCGFGRGWSFGVAGCGRSPLLAEGLMGGAGWSTLMS